MDASELPLSFFSGYKQGEKTRMSPGSRGSWERRLPLKLRVRRDLSPKDCGLPSFNTLMMAPQYLAELHFPEFPFLRVSR